MLTGMSQALAFNYLKVAGLKALGRASRGQMVSVSWVLEKFGSTTSSTNTYVTNSGVKFSSSMIPDENLPKMRFLKNVNPCPSAYNADDLIANGDSVGAFLLFDGFAAIKNGQGEEGKKDLKSATILIRVPDDSASEPSQSNNYATVSGSTTKYKTSECVVSLRPKHGGYAHGDPLFFIEEDEMAKVKELMKTTGGDDPEENTEKKNAKNNNSQATTPEELAASIGTIFLLVAGVGRFLGPFASDFTTSYGIPKSIYYVIACAAMALPFGMLASYGWKLSGTEKNNFTFSESDCVGLKALTCVFAFGYGISFAQAPVYLKTLLPTNAIGRVYSKLRNYRDGA